MSCFNLSGKSGQKEQFVKETKLLIKKCANITGKYKKCTGVWKNQTVVADCLVFSDSVLCKMQKKAVVRYLSRCKCIDNNESPLFAVIFR